MKRVAAGILAILLAGPAWAGAFRSAQVCSGATWVVHADLEQIRQTQVGAFLTNRLSSGPMADKLAAFAAVFGFDPRKDVSAVTLYGKSKNPALSVALFSGKFNEAQLVTLLKVNDSYESHVFGRHTIHSWIDDKKPEQGRQYGCVHPSGVMLIGRGMEMIQEALGVLDGKQPCLDAASAFGSKLPTQAPFFMAGADMRGIGEPAAAPGEPQEGSTGWLSISEKDGQVNVSAMVSAADAQRATNIQALAMGMVAASQFAADKRPELAKFAQAVRVTQADKNVLVDVSCPVEQAMALITEGMSAKQGRHAAHDTPSP